MSTPECLGRAFIHNHTTYSDGTMTPIELLLSCQNQAVRADVFAVTDHNEIKAYWELQEYMAKHNIKFPELIAGEEISVPEHLLVLFENEPFLIPPYLRLRKTIDYVLDRDEKALLIIAHPGKNPFFLLDPYSYVGNRIHGIERRSPFNAPFDRQVEEIHEELKDNGIILAALSGGDNHHKYEYGLGWPYYTGFNGRTKKEFFACTREGKTTAEYDQSVITRRPTKEMEEENRQRALVYSFPKVVKDLVRSFRR